MGGSIDLLVETISQTLQEIYEIGEDKFARVIEELKRELGQISEWSETEGRAAVKRAIERHYDSEDAEDILSVLENKVFSHESFRHAAEPVEDIAEIDVIAERPIMRDESESDSSVVVASPEKSYKRREKPGPGALHNRDSPRHKERDNTEKHKCDSKKAQVEGMQREKAGWKLPPPYMMVPPVYAGMPRQFPIPYPASSPQVRVQQANPPQSPSMAPQTPLQEQSQQKEGGKATRRSKKEEAPAKRHENSTSVLLRNVPDSQNDIKNVYDFFNHFGGITSISVDTARRTSLIRFSKQESAIAAKRSADPIFGNPSIRLVYDLPIENPAASERSLSSSKPSTSATPVVETIAGKRSAKELQREKGKQAQEYMEQNTQKLKDLIASLGKKGITEEERKEIDENIDKVKSDMKICSQESRMQPTSEKSSPKPSYSPRPYLPSPKRKKFELTLEEISPELRSYNGLIAKLNKLVKIDSVKFTGDNSASIQVYSESDQQKLLASSPEGFRVSLTHT